MRNNGVERRTREIVLLSLFERDKSTPTEISNRTGINVVQISNILTEFEYQRKPPFVLHTKEFGRDKRCTHYYLTEIGKMNAQLSRIDDAFGGNEETAKTLNGILETLLGGKPK